MTYSESRIKRIEISGYCILIVGLVLLAFTFYNAYLLLTGVLKIPVPGDLIAAFGEMLAPLIETAIRAIYLGIMGWIGSILTRRGVQVITSPIEEVRIRKPTTEPVEPTEPQPKEEVK